jgi:hypothetical protein
MIYLRVTNMCVGEKRSVVIPAGHGWDHAPTSTIVTSRGKSLPKGADIQIEIELLRFHDPAPSNADFFSEMDSNGDGLVSKPEMDRWFKDRHPRRMGHLPHGLWERQDLNGDGFVTWDEFSGPKGANRPGGGTDL